MDTKRVLYFLSVLSHETSGHPEELSKLFQRALDENDDIVELTALLEDLAFYNEVGGALKRDGEDIIELAYGAPQQAYEMLPQVRQVSESIKSSLLASERVLADPRPNTSTVSVLRRSELPNYIRCLRQIASSCVHLMLIYGGVDAVKDLTWNDTVGILEMLNNVTNRLLTRLMTTPTPEYSWIVRKKRIGGAAFFTGDAYFLSYDRRESVELLCAGLKKERMGTHAFYNTEAFDRKEDTVPFCWGTGNLVSTMPGNAIDTLGSSFCTKLRGPSETELHRPVPVPYELAVKLSNGRNFCITPDELVSGMNQWQAGYDINRNLKSHVCPICGRHPGSSYMICASHFKSEM